MQRKSHACPCQMTTCQTPEQICCSKENMIYGMFTLEILWSVDLLKCVMDFLFVGKTSLNSLVPGKFEWNFRHVTFKQIDGWGMSCEIALIWMSLDFISGQSTLVQVMAWCHQATSHYLSQCWPRPLLPYDVTRPQWVNYHRALMFSLIYAWKKLLSKQ